MMTQQASEPRILVADDEPAIRESLRVALAPDGYQVLETDRGMAVLDAVRRRETDLILLDLGLPDVDGMLVIRRIRYAKSDIPIIVLSNRGDEEAKVHALDLGADDYIVKPFGIDELLARIRVLRRYRIRAKNDNKTLRAGDLVLDLERRVVVVRGVEVRLSPREHQLLHMLVAHAGKVLTHGFILRQVWGAETDVQYVRMYIRALRQKIEVDPERPKLITTESGVGYRLVVPSSSSSGLVSEDAGVTL